MIKRIARKFYNLLSDSKLKHSLSSVFYRIFYEKSLSDYRIKDGVFTAKFKNGIEVKSVRAFDPEAVCGELFDYDFKEGSTVMDLGGHYGIVAIFMAKSVGDKGKVVVFEADPANFAVLQKNLDLNGVYNVTAVNKGVYNVSGELEFYSGGGYTSSFEKTDYVEKKNNNYSAIKVKVGRLDDEFLSLEIDGVDFIKMDIEGSEVPALEGMVEILEKFLPDLMIETHITEGKFTTPKVVEIIEKIGYDKIEKKNYKGRGGFVFAGASRKHN